MIYTLTFYDAAGQPISSAVFNVPSPDDFLGCLLQAIKSGWVEGTASISFAADPV
jgi:hypothetical protein